jgi:hypothetical protein
MRDRHGGRCRYWSPRRTSEIKRKRNQPGISGIAMPILRDGDVQKTSNFRGESSLAAETRGMP